MERKDEVFLTFFRGFLALFLFAISLDKTYSYSGAKVDNIKMLYNTYGGNVLV